MNEQAAAPQLVIVSGMFGFGRSLGPRTLDDVGFF